jgi:hypothetical protein
VGGINFRDGLITVEGIDYFPTRFTLSEVEIARKILKSYDGNGEV